MESLDTNCIAAGGAALWVATQRAAWLLGVSRDKPRHCREARDTAQHACDTTGAGPATWHTARHDTAQFARGLGAVRAAWAHRARSQGPLGVHLVHPT